METGISYLRLVFWRMHAPRDAFPELQSAGSAVGMKRDLKGTKWFSFGPRVSSVTLKLLKSAPLQSARFSICHLAERLSV